MFAFVSRELQGARRLTLLLLLLGVKTAEVLSNDISCLVIMNPLSTHVPIDDISLRVEHKDSIIRHSLDKHSKAPLAVRERVLSFTPFDNVLPEGSLDALPLLNLF